MITPFGKELKKLRIDLGITLADMSRNLGKSAAFLSAIETGRKRIPDDFLDLLSQKYDEVKKLKSHYEVLINHARKEIPLPSDATVDDTMFATALTRKFNTLSPEDKIELQGFLDKIGGGT